MTSGSYYITQADRVTYSTRNTTSKRQMNDLDIVHIALWAKSVLTLWKRRGGKKRNISSYSWCLQIDGRWDEGERHTGSHVVFRNHDNESDVLVCGQ